MVPSDTFWKVFFFIWLTTSFCRTHHLTISVKSCFRLPHTVKLRTVDRAIQFWTLLVKDHSTSIFLLIDSPKILGWAINRDMLLLTTLRWLCLWQVKKGFWDPKLRSLWEILCTYWLINKLFLLFLQQTWWFQHMEWSGWTNILQFECGCRVTASASFLQQFQ